MKTAMCTVLCVVLANVCVLQIKCAAQDWYESFEVNYNVTLVDGLGPVIYISSRLIPFPGERFISLTWSRYLSSIGTYKRFASRGVLLRNAPARFTLNVVDNNTEVLSIRNVLKEDSWRSWEAYGEFRVF